MTVLILIAVAVVEVTVVVVVVIIVPRCKSGDINKGDVRSSNGCSSSGGNTNIVLVLVAEAIVVILAVLCGIGSCDGGHWGWSVIHLDLSAIIIAEIVFLLHSANGNACVKIKPIRSIKSALAFSSYIWQVVLLFDIFTCMTYTTNAETVFTWFWAWDI